MNDGFAISFPVYSLLLKDGSGVMLLQGGNSLFLPLFTDDDSVRTYLERFEINECQVVALPNAKSLADFLRNPPSRSKPSMVQTVIVDPISPNPRAVTVFQVSELLPQLEAR